MKQDKRSLYLLQDGTHADPKDCSVAKDGILRHKNGLSVAVNDEGKPTVIGAEVAGDDVATTQADMPNPVDDIAHEPVVAAPVTLTADVTK